jgi:endonuclease/exonuclease/phosphatase (EEP) superfamily protein YafD
MMARPVSIVFVAALAGATAACGRPAPPAVRAPAPGEPVVSILTYNVNYGIAGEDDTLAAIGRPRADVVLLQETSAAWEQAIRGAWAGDYPSMTFQHRGGAGGMAVLSRLPVDTVQFLGPSGEGWFPAVRVVVRAAFGPLQILSVHLRPPFSEGGSLVVGYFTTPSVRRAEIAAFFAQLDPSLPTMIAGDFNEEPGGGVTRFLAEKGMVSALPLFAPDQPTWRWATSVGTFRKQLDHVVLDRRLEPIRVQVLPDGESDHLPVLALLRRAPPSRPRRRRRRGHVTRCRGSRRPRASTAC